MIQTYILVFSFIFIALYCIDEPKFIYNVTCSQFNFNHCLLMAVYVDSTWLWFYSHCDNFKYNRQLQGRQCIYMVVQVGK